MKQPNALLKVAAVASSVLLVGGLVSFRAGAFDSFVRPDPPAVEPESAPAPDAAQASDPPQAFMGGSKSAAVFTPDLDMPTLDPAPKASPPPPTFLGGSKSLAPLIPPKGPPAPTTPAPPAPPG